LLINVGYDIRYEAAFATPMVIMLSIHPSRHGDIVGVEAITTQPDTPVSFYRDSFGNVCGRLTAPPGGVEISCRATVRDSGLPDAVVPTAVQLPIEQLPDECLVYLMGSRYCETDRLSDIAWKLFKDTPLGWARVAAICDFVHSHITFGYVFAAPTKTAYDVYESRQGVCRDFAHLAVALCRCMNIPARYCTGYLGDIGVPLDENPMDFSGWFEAYLGGSWYTFDARHNKPRIGRIVMGRGRDAADVALSTSFGLMTLQKFQIYTDEVKA
jgi:transglutaminase-like putative cysteine protease